MNGVRERIGLNTASLNFQLQYLTETKPSKKHPEGQTTWTPQGYFNSVAGALRRIMKMPPHLKGTGPYDLQAFALWVESWHVMICNSLIDAKVRNDWLKPDAKGNPGMPLKRKNKRYVTVKPKPGAVIVTLT